MEWLYPELKRIDPKERSSALQEAKDSPFGAIELVGIGIALVLAVVVTRYSATGMGALGRIGAALWNFMVAIPILLVFAGPFYDVGFVEAFANTLKNVRGRKQIKLDRGMISASDSSKVHRPTAAMRTNAQWRLLARRLPLGAGAAMQPFAEMRSLSIVCFGRTLGTAALGPTAAVQQSR
jgi:hypothetical protein